MKLYAASVSEGQSALAQAMHMTVETGQGGDASCVGFTTDQTVADGPLSDLLSTVSYATAVGAWDAPAGSTTTTYKFSWDLPATADNSTQDTTVSADFVFEAQSV